MKTTCLILLLSISFFSACNKDDDAPSIDEENTFSCKINGELFVPREHGGFNRKDGITVTLFPDNSWLFILGDGDNKIYMYLYNIENTGSFIISESDGNGDFLNETANVIELESSENSNYRSIGNTGTLNVIGFDINNKIILEFENIQLVDNDNPNAVLNLIDGKLNVNLETLNQ